MRSNEVLLNHHWQGQKLARKGIVTSVGMFGGLILKLALVIIVIVEIACCVNSEPCSESSLSIGLKPTLKDATLEHEARLDVSYCHLLVLTY